MELQQISVEPVNVPVTVLGWQQDGKKVKSLSLGILQPHGGMQSCI